ncbi:MAG: hypothetical protein M3Z66_22740 [Chloroflexota bacterium]|nr:hypothetical protein [Chloroflexota bacterium]
MVCLAAAWVTVLSPLLNPRATPTQIGLDYTRHYMVWESGPSLVSTHTLALRQLSAAMRSSLPLPTQHDVNVPDLIHRYGANRSVDMVVVRGVFNSLPPDEGIVVRGTVVVLVDGRSNRVLFMTF